MNTFAEFQCLGRVGKIKQVGNVMIVSVAAEYGKRDATGDFQSNTFWNDVTIFKESTAKWISENINPGDLVHTRGTIRSTQYEKGNGEKAYGTTLAASEFSLLAKKQDKPEENQN